MGQVAMAEPALLDGSRWNSGFQVEGAPKPKKDSGFTVSSYSLVSPSYTRVLGIPILRGRNLAEADTATSTHVAVINQSAAKEFFPNMDPLGRRFKQGYDPDAKEAPVWYTVVGICADTQYSGLRETKQPLYFSPIVQSKEVSGATFVVRTSRPIAETVPTIRRAIAGIDPDLPLMNVRTLDEQIADSLRQERLIATLTAGFGVLALVLASVGIYGLMAYTVAQRTNEIGIRLALREVTALTLLGTVAGAVAVLTAMHLMHNILFNTEENSQGGMLFGLHGYDPASLAITAAVLFALSLLAGWVPAARASRVEPMEALRAE